MRAGKLRHRVAIQAKTLTQDAYGEMVATWATAETVWGELTPLIAGTREAFTQQGDQWQARVAYQCRLRHRELSPVTNRLLIEGRYFEVTAVMDPDGRTHELLAMCFEVLD